MLKYLITIFAALMLASCGGSLPWNDQEYAGITNAYVQLVKCEAADGSESVCIDRAEVKDGKARSDVSLDIVYPVGDKSITVGYRAEGVTVDGQAIRAAVEQANAEVLGKILTPEAITSIVEKVMGVFGGA